MSSPCDIIMHIILYVWYLHAMNDLTSHAMIITGETSCSYWTGRAPSSSKFLRDRTIHTLLESIYAISCIDHTYGRSSMQENRWKSRIWTSYSPTTDSNGVWMVWIWRSSDGYGARSSCPYLQALTSSSCKFLLYLHGTTYLCLVLTF